MGGMKENGQATERKGPENERNAHAEQNHVPLRESEISVRNSHQRERGEEK